MFRPRTSAARRGLTLIELVVVMAVIAVLAAMVIPRLDFLKNQAENAAAAGTQADLNAMLQVQRTSSGAFPTLDLLIDTGGAAYSKLFSIGSAPVIASTLTNSMGERWYGSFLDGGLLYALRHDPAATNASNSASATAGVDLVSEAASGSLKVAELNPGATYVSDIVKVVFPGGITYGVVTPAVVDNPATTDVDESAPAVYGSITGTAGVVPSGVKLIALGIGPKNSAVGNTISSTPMETGSDDPTKVYCRYIAIFAIYSSGKPAQLKMVVDHRFKQIDKRIDQFKSQGATGV